MQPKKGSPIVEIPITFDYVAKPQGLGNDKFVIAGLLLLLWLVGSIIYCFTDTTIIRKILFIIGFFVVDTTFVRFIILRERYFNKRRLDLIEKNYQYPTSQIWDIYEITGSYPYICRYANGLKAIFAVFDKDVIVGREADNDYYHYEAISNAYLQMHKRGIDCMHIDYMDTVSKDDRINALFDIAANAKNPNLADVLTRIFDNVNYIMQHSYASYDVYCFFYAGKDELFWDELGVVINQFLEGNYIRCRILNKEEIGDLVKSVFNISNFSVNTASETLFTDLGGLHYLTPIWIERGSERKILNKTREEKEAEKNVRQAERNVTKRKKSVSERKKDKYMERQAIDIFGEDGGQQIEQMQGLQMSNQQMYNQQMQGQQMYNQQMQGQQMYNQQMPNQQMYNQQMQGQQMFNRQMPNQQMPNQQMPNMNNGQQMVSDNIIFGDGWDKKPKVENKPKENKKQKKQKVNYDEEIDLFGGDKTSNTAQEVQSVDETTPKKKNKSTNYDEDTEIDLF